MKYLRRIIERYRQSLPRHHRRDRPQHRGLNSETCWSWDGSQNTLIKLFKENIVSTHFMYLSNSKNDTQLKYTNANVCTKTKSNGSKTMYRSLNFFTSEVNVSYTQFLNKNYDSAIQDSFKIQVALRT